MKLDLNTKEYLALYGLLERQVPHSDKNLAEVHNRMKATLLALLLESEKSLFERWYNNTGQKVNELISQQPKPTIDQIVQPLADDDNEFPVREYPKRSKAGNNKPRKR